MASDILIVDDEADIRELVAGILQDEGYQHPHGARQRQRAFGHRGAAAEPGVPRHLAAGQPARRPAVARQHQAAASRTAGGDDLRPRQHRDRGRRDQARRLRLHREAVQGRPAGAGRRPRAGNLAAQARGEGAEAARAAAIFRGRPLAADQSAAPDHREGRADQQPHPDRRPLRLRQGAGRAHHAPAVGPRRSAVRGDQRGRDHAGAHGNRAVRRRGVQRHAGAQGRRAGGGATAARCSSTKSPTCRARRRTRSCACWSTRPSSASAAIPRSRSTCASCRRPRATSKRRSPPADSARISITGCRWCRSACRRWPSGARTSRIWSTISWSRSRSRPACPSGRSAPTRWRCCNRTTGRATSASCATTSSG